MKIDAKGLYYKELNEKIREAIRAGEKEIILDNVNGQRYIGAGIKGDAKIIINGTPGNDLAAFMDGLTLEINSNAQDAIGNTMSSGKIIVYGNAGDIIGYGMRGGKIFIKGDVGYRVGIHMKEYQNFRPVIMAGGTAGDFLGEYMAGGVLIVLGLNQPAEAIVGNLVGTGMHGGVIYLRGKVEPYQLGKEVGVGKWSEEDKKNLKTYLAEFCKDFNLNFDRIIKDEFIKLVPLTHRPYGSIYAY